MKLYGPARAVAESFKFRSKTGKDVAIQALRRYLGRSGRDLEALIRHAGTCRVESIMKPYMEALL